MSYSRNTTRTLNKYGVNLALQAYALNKNGEGANTISWYILPAKLAGKTRVADALIDAGREIAKFLPITSKPYESINF